MTEFRPNLTDSNGSAIFSGNASYLELVDGLVEARFDYDPPDSDIVERLPLQEVIELLEGWRTEVIRLDPDATKRLPPSSSTDRTRAPELGPQRNAPDHLAG